MLEPDLDDWDIRCVRDHLRATPGAQVIGSRVSKNGPMRITVAGAPGVSLAIVVWPRVVVLDSQVLSVHREFPGIRAAAEYAGRLHDVESRLAARRGFTGWPAFLVHWNTAYRLAYRDVYTRCAVRLSDGDWSLVTGSEFVTVYRHAQGYCSATDNLSVPRPEDLQVLTELVG